jgi:hypothetical protein
MVKSFFKTLKPAEVCAWEHETVVDVEKRIPSFIEAV